jgi:multicomponent Na+:H+ antiporter subunit A
MLNIIFIGFLAAIAAPFIHKFLPKLSGALLTLVPAGFFVYLANMIAPIAKGEVLLLSYTWFPSLDININFVVDGLSLTFALIISGIGAIIVFYASGYLHGHKKLARFYGYLLFFMTSMLGVVLSDNIIALFIFWELTSISSYLLIGFNHESERSRYAALQALLVTGGGGLALMAGLIIMGNVGGSYNISELIAQSSVIVGHSLYLPILILVLLGAFTKSAQFPFHFWLPNAMEAPTPVSAYLHSATMVKAGVFLLARFNPILSGTDVWHITLTVFGGITMLMGASMAVGQNDLKRILAYTTVSALGIMVFLIGLGGPYAITAAITFLVVHSMYKGGLFLVAGAIDHETGTRDIRRLGGLKAHLPLIFLGAILAAFSYSGIPPFLGFVAKELVYETTAHFAVNPIILTVVAVLTNMFLVATAIMVGVKPFFGKYLETPKHPHHAPLTLWLGPVLLGLLGLALGVVPSWISKGLIGPSVDAIALTDGVKLALWHGFTPILALSVLTLVGGVGLYYLSGTIKKQQAFFDKLAEFGPEEGYKALLKGLVTFSSKQTNFFQNGYLRHYFYWILTTFMLLVLYTIYSKELYTFLKVDFSGIYFYEALLVIIMLLASYSAIKSKTVLSSVASLGIVGYGIALIFSFFSAPDLALTQFSIETLTVILLVLIVYKVPKFTDFSPLRNRRRDAVLSIAAGLTITLLVMLVLNMPADSYISSYFLENSYVKAHGRNVVNVILVDFRGFDTMGEITVLTLAAIGVYTLLRFRNGGVKKGVNEKMNNG